MGDIIKQSTMLLKIIYYKGPNWHLLPIQWIYGQICSLIYFDNNNKTIPLLILDCILFGCCVVTLYHGKIKH